MDEAKAGDSVPVRYAGRLEADGLRHLQTHDAKAHICKGNGGSWTGRTVGHKAGAEGGDSPQKDQRTGKRTEGVVAQILTNSSFHPHGIKVRLADGQVGRVARIHG